MKGRDVYVKGGASSSKKKDPYGIEGPSEICTQSAEVRLAVSGAQPLFTLALLMFAFIPSRLAAFAVEPQYLHQDFLALSKVSFEGHVQNPQKISCWFKI